MKLGVCCLCREDVHSEDGPVAGYQGSVVVHPLAHAACTYLPRPDSCDWHEYKQRACVIAVDFDGTIVRNRWPRIGPALPGVFAGIRELNDYAPVDWVLHTCREGAPLHEAVSWCARVGLPLRAVNANTPEVYEQFGSDSRKPSADIYIDDRAAGAPLRALGGEWVLDWAMVVPEVKRRIDRWHET